MGSLKLVILPEEISPSEILTHWEYMYVTYYNKNSLDFINCFWKIS